MHPRLLALGLVAALGIGGVAGCGGSDDDSTSAAAPTTTATVPDGKLSASTAPPRLGFYSGVDCEKLAKGTCKELFQASREGHHAYCRGGKPNKGVEPDFKFKGKFYNYVCFTLKTDRDLVDFWYGERNIVKNVYVSADRFPETCEAGYCVQGEWFGTRPVEGKIRNPNKEYSTYEAEFLSSN